MQLAALLATGWIVLSCDAPPKKPDQLYAFGDSYTDIGRLVDYIGFQHEVYDEGRFCDGPIWAETFAARVGFTLPIERDFAVGGALSTRFHGGYASPHPLAETGVLSQVDWFFDQTEGVDHSDSVVAIFGGINDFLTDPAVSPQSIVDNIFLAVDNMGNVGVKTFIVVNVPDVSRSPFAIDTRPANDLAVMHDGIAQFADLIADQAPTHAAENGFQIAVVDCFGLFNGILADPGRLGLTNVTDSYRDSPDYGVIPVGQFFWIDGVHPTSPVQDALANEAIKQYRVVTCGTTTAQ